MDNNYDPNRGTSQSYIPSYGAQQPQAIFTEEKPHRGKLLIIIIACVIAAAAAVLIYMNATRSGWDSNGEKYYSDGDALTGWQQIENEWYYFDAEGIKQTGWVEADGESYYLNGDGVRQTGFLTLGEKTYYLDKETGARFSGWLDYADSGILYYFNERLDGAMITGKWSIGGENYYFDAEGKMATGTVTVSAEESAEYGDKGEVTYYFDDSGHFVSKDVTLTGDNLPLETDSTDENEFRVGSSVWNGKYSKFFGSVSGCTALNMSVNNTLFGYSDCEWTAFIRTDSGWENLGQFTVSGGSGKFDKVFDTPITFDAYKLVPSTSEGMGSFRYSESINKIVLHSEEFGSVRGTI